MMYSHVTYEEHKAWLGRMAENLNEVGLAELVGFNMAGACALPDSWYSDRADLRAACERGFRDGKIKLAVDEIMRPRR